jgi:hypothetical protein
VYYGNLLDLKNENENLKPLIEDLRNKLQGKEFEEKKDKNSLRELNKICEDFSEKNTELDKRANDIEIFYETKIIELDKQIREEYITEMESMKR